VLIVHSDVEPANQFSRFALDGDDWASMEGSCQVKLPMSKLPRGHYWLTGSIHFERGSLDQQVGPEQELYPHYFEVVEQSPQE
jgi:hypothetical protein